MRLVLDTNVVVSGLWTDDGLAIIIEGKREDWPGGPRTLTPRASGREPNGRTLWYGAELNPDGRQVWFRITAEAVCRGLMRPVASAYGWPPDVSPGTPSPTTRGCGPSCPRSRPVYSRPSRSRWAAASVRHGRSA